MAILEQINNLFKKGEGVNIGELIDSVLFLETDDRDKALGQLVDALVKSGKVADGQLFLEAILKREEIVSTGIGMNVAIPHAKLSCFDEFFIAIGIKQNDGIEWDSLDGKPVSLIFLIGGPADQQTKYLEILSHLTITIKNPERRSALLSANTHEEINRIFDIS